MPNSFLFLTSASFRAAYNIRPYHLYPQTSCFQGILTTTYWFARVCVSVRKSSRYFILWWFLRWNKKQDTVFSHFRLDRLTLVLVIKGRESFKILIFAPDFVFTVRVLLSVFHEFSVTWRIQLVTNSWSFRDYRLHWDLQNQNILFIRIWYIIKKKKLFCSNPSNVVDGHYRY